MEIWKPHPISGYLVSNTGRVINPETGYELKPTVRASGYARIGNYVCSGGSVHCAVAEAFIGIIPKGMQVNHIDGVKLNNNLSNLEIVTPQENVIHAYATGLAKGKRGEDNSGAKVTKEQVLDMYNLFELGYNNDYVAEQVGLHSRYVSLVRHGRRWTWLYEEIGKVFPKSFGHIKGNLSRVIESWELIKNTNLINKVISDKTGLEASCVSRLRSGQMYKDFVDWYDSRGLT